MNLRFELHGGVCWNAGGRGAEGAGWLARVPRLVAELESAWGIKVGRIFPNATEAYVSEASKANGEQVVLKVPLAGSEKSARELGMLQAANGRGYVRLLRYDPESGAMLLERLGPQLAQMNNPVDKQIEIICATLQSAWMPLPHGMYAMA